MSAVDTKAVKSGGGCPKAALCGAVGCVSWAELGVAGAGYLVPGIGSLVALGVYRCSADTRNFLISCQRPAWAPTCVYTYIALDVAAVAPVGCAAMLAFKYGGATLGNRDVSTGLGALALSGALSALIVPAAVSKNLRLMGGLSLATAGAGAVAASAFGRVNNRPALMLLPWTFAHLLYAILAASTKPPLFDDDQTEIKTVG